MNGYVLVFMFQNVNTMGLAEQIEHGTLASMFRYRKSRMRYKRFLKKQNRRVWRRFKDDLKPMYNRFFKWEY